MSMTWEGSNTQEPVRWPATLSTKEAAQVLGYSQSEVKRLCSQNKLPLMPRVEGARYRIVTARLFRELGIIA